MRHRSQRITMANRSGRTVLPDMDGRTVLDDADETEVIEPPTACIECGAMHCADQFGLCKACIR